MNKELEEVKEYLKHEVKAYENNKEINQLIGGKSGEIQHKLNITLLNYIENSIPKEVIEKEIEELEKIAKKADMIPETVKEEKINGDIVYSQRFKADGYIAEVVIKVLKKLLEGK